MFLYKCLLIMLQVQSISLIIAGNIIQVWPSEREPFTAIAAKKRL